MASSASDKETIREIRAKSLDPERDKDDILKLEKGGCQLLVQFRGKYYKLFSVFGENPMKPNMLDKEFDHILRVEIIPEYEKVRIKVLEILKSPGKAETADQKNLCF
jgi:hypothetical protein